MKKYRQGHCHGANPRTMALTCRWSNRRSSIINLKAAKQIGLTIPPNVFAILGELAGTIQDFAAHFKKRREKGC
jgi:hypothetical protein